MNYSALIENRKSVRAFTGKTVPAARLGDIRKYYRNEAKRLLPELRTDLVILDNRVQQALEGSAGYNEFLVGAPHYLILLSDQHELSGLNAGYIMEDLVLKLQDMGLSSCWITFTDSQKIKKAAGIVSPLEIAAIVAFGYGEKTTKRLRINILSMSNVDISAKRHYFDPKRSIVDMVYLNTWGNSSNVNDHIGFFDDMLWEAFRAASLAPSYLNRQAYGFVLRDGCVTLVSRADDFTTKADGDLSLGIVMLHFSAVAEGWAGKVNWQFAPDAADLELPEGYAAVASCCL